LGKAGAEEDIRPVKFLSVVEAEASSLGSCGADSSIADGFRTGVDLTSKGAESVFLGASSESAEEFALASDAIRISGELAAPAEGFSRGAAVAILRAEVGLVAFARAGVVVEGEDGGSG
jgi:hypothetical protein